MSSRAQGMTVGEQKRGAGERGTPGFRLPAVNWAVAAEPEAENSVPAPGSPAAAAGAVSGVANGEAAGVTGGAATVVPAPPTTTTAAGAEPPVAGAAVPAGAVAGSAPADPGPDGEAGTAGPRPGRVSRPMVAAAVAVGLVLVGGSVVATRLGGSEPKHGPAQADAPPGYGPEGGDGGNGFVPGFDQHGGTAGTPAPAEPTPGAPAAGESGSPAPGPDGQPPAAPAAGTGEGGTGEGGTGRSAGGAPRSGGAANPTAGAAAPAPGSAASGGGAGGSASGGTASGGTAGGAAPQPAPGAVQQPAPQPPAPKPPVASPPPAPAPVVAVVGPYCGGSKSVSSYAQNGWFDQGVSGWRSSSGGWSGDGCNGTYTSVPMSGDANKDDGNSVVWTFSPANVKNCTLAVYIPADDDVKRVGGHPTLYTVRSGGSSWSFSIDQTANRGRWVSQATTYSYQGPLSVTLHTRGLDWKGGTKTYDHHAASAIKATCTT
ncbi:hypothetical protein ACFVHB_29955 [Kitasatospora sp. NPDC127111]|uniref:hypothetical protein n=1 Tax=Kitasatospora sp. NPDC127111 TaxID=3345363 RepID=UPI00362B90B1